MIDSFHYLKRRSSCSGYLRARKLDSRIYPFHLYPQGHLFAQRDETTLRALPELSEMAYDDVMTLLDDFESGAIEYKYSPEDIEEAFFGGARSAFGYRF